MHRNEGGTNINYGTNVQTTERWVADADWQNILELPIDGGYLCLDPIYSYHIFITYDSISTWYNIDKTNAAGWIKRDMILDRCDTLVDLAIVFSIKATIKISD